MSIALGVVGTLALAPLVLWDVRPELFPATAHALLGTIPLATIALLYVLHQHLRRAGRGELARAALVAAAFLFWAANQLWADRPMATLLNDIAIAGFVLDLVLAMVQQPSPSSLPAPAGCAPAAEPPSRAERWDDGP
ncbi:MAG TPA: hypothetical protein VEK07_19040 [Polyangiaceae bacterium]|nr:hypothetical protein [Polyangiaceae bacterium]